MICSKNVFRILTKSVKTIRSLIFSKCLVVLRKECTKEEGQSEFLILTIFTILFTLCLIFIRVWPIEELLFEIRHLDKLHKLYDKFKYIQDTKSAQISQKHDGYNTHVIIAQLSPKWLCGNSDTWPHNVCNVQWTSSLYIKTCWQNSVICVHAGVILETEDRIWQSSSIIDTYCFIAI